MELVVFEKNKLLKKRLNKETMTELEREAESFMHMCCFTTMLVDEDNKLLFKRHTGEIFSIQEFRKDTTTEFFWLKLQNLWDAEQNINENKSEYNCEEIKEDYIKCFDIAQLFDRMYPSMPGAFTGTVSERLDRHLKRIISERKY